MATWFTQERLLRIGTSLVLAVLLWATVKLSNTYFAVVSVPVAYEGIPSNFKLTSPLPQRLRLRVEGVGHQLLVPAFRSLRDTLTVDLSPHLATGSVRTAAWRSDLQQYLSDAIRIEDISPDTLSLRYANKEDKRVPVVSALTVEAASGYRFTRPLRFVPDSVTLQGTRSELEAVSSWPTEAVTLSDLRQTERVVIPLALSNEIFVEPREVLVELPLARFTEKALQVPIEVLGLPVGKRIRFLPGTVELRCLVPLDRYDEVRADDFTLTVDYSQLQLEATQAFPKVVRHPGFVQGIRLSPQSVRFVITNR